MSADALVHGYEQQERHGHQSGKTATQKTARKSLAQIASTRPRAGAEECPDRIERLTQTESGTPELRWGMSRPWRPWRATHTFPDSVQQARSQDEADARGDGKERLGECAKA